MKNKKMPKSGTYQYIGDTTHELKYFSIVPHGLYYLKFETDFLGIKLVTISPCGDRSYYRLLYSNFIEFFKNSWERVL